MTTVEAAHERYRLAVLELKGAAEQLDVLQQPIYPSAVRTVQQLVADHYGIRLGELWGQVRINKIAAARFVAMYLLWTVARIPQREICAYFNRDRASVNYAIRVVSDRCATEKKFAAEVEQLSAACLAAIGDNGQKTEYRPAEAMSQKSGENKDFVSIPAPLQKPSADERLHSFSL